MKVFVFVKSTRTANTEVLGVFKDAAKACIALSERMDDWSTEGGKGLVEDVTEVIPNFFYSVVTKNGNVIQYKISECELN